jgi:hypothetical protein
MLKIFLSLFIFVTIVWTPIIIYVFLDRNKMVTQSPAQKMLAPVAPEHFGKGSISHFSLYLQGKSTVAVKSIRDICAWLVDCKYVSDTELFDHPDLWQYPVDFEVKRQGDCEDHCLWAWRKLHDLGMDAEFVVGKIAQGEGVWGDHSWILLKDGGEEHVMETTAKRMNQFLVPDLKAKKIYKPYFSIDTQLRSYVYQRSNTQKK